MRQTEDMIVRTKSYIDYTIIGSEIPIEIIKEYKQNHKGKYRERVYGLKETLTGMLIQSLEENKSEEHIVNVLHVIHHNRIQEIEKAEQVKKKKYIEEGKKHQGRPRKYFVNGPKSIRKDISLNTASYDEAKQRFPVELLEEVFKHKVKGYTKSDERNWKGHRVVICDGTCLKTVDTKELSEYFTPEKKKLNLPLPTVRLEGLIDLYGSCVSDYRIGKYKEGELSLLKSMHPDIPAGTIILGDDLYGTYGHYAYCIENNKELITQGKHKHNERIIKVIKDNDVLVEWKLGACSIWFKDKESHPDKMILRKLSAINPKKPDEMSHFYTTLLDAIKYPAKDILALYFCRWDIELTFREIKIIMEIEYTRGKTVDNVKKEIISHLIVYNIIRQMTKSVFTENDEDFFSLRTSIQKNDRQSTNNAASYVDKLGRSYSKKSSGRNTSTSLRVKKN